MFRSRLFEERRRFRRELPNRCFAGQQSSNKSHPWFLCPGSVVSSSGNACNPSAGPFGIPKRRSQIMTPQAVPYGRVTQKQPAVAELHILWITAGLGCDGDSVSITAATQPSIEDVLLGAIPGLPKVHLHNPVLAVEVGDDFMKFWYDAEAGKLDPFVLVVEGSIPNETIKKEGYWAAMGTGKDGQPIKTREWIDRL